MERNRYFKATLGVGAEVIIANTLDASGAEVDGIKPTAATSTLTIAASPAAGDRINITVLGQPYTYTVLATDTTAAILVASMQAYFNAFNAPWTLVITGTTAATFTYTPNAVGTALNGGTNAIALGTPNVSTFSAPVATAQFGSNGVNGSPAGFQPTFQAFAANAAAGSLAVYWDDNLGQVTGSNSNTSVPPGALTQYANNNRAYFYAWKDAAGNTLRTSQIPVQGRKTTISRYQAATPDIFTVALGGTVTAGQTIWIRIIDKTSAAVPFPNWEYSVLSTGNAITDATALVALLTAEKFEIPIATATNGGTSTITITGLSNNRILAVNCWLDVAGILNSGTALSTDQSAFVVTQTQTRTVENGTFADVTEVEKFLKIRNGVMVYVASTITPSEFNNFNSNIVSTTQYGYLLVRSIRGFLIASQSTVGPITSQIGYCYVYLPDTIIANLYNNY